jgi:hypothetical protein
MMCSQTFAQDEWPLVGGDYWDVTGVEIKDGGSWEYANWLATEWRKNEEFSKAQGWTKEFMILANTYARDGEPDLYLIRVIEEVPSGPEGEKRQKEFMAWKKSTAEAMVKASGNRAEYREVQSSTLLQVLNFR